MTSFSWFPYYFPIGGIQTSLLSVLLNLFYHLTWKEQFRCSWTAVWNWLCCLLDKAHRKGKWSFGFSLAPYSSLMENIRDGIWGFWPFWNTNWLMHCLKPKWCCIITVLPKKELFCLNQTLIKKKEKEEEERRKKKKKDKISWKWLRKLLYAIDA